MYKRKLSVNQNMSPIEQSIGLYLIKIIYCQICIIMYILGEYKNNHIYYNICEMVFSDIL